VSSDLIQAALGGDEDAFRGLVDPYRRELQVHCYRILGSLSDAEDALQETLLAAWQGLGTFEGRSSIRTWLYRIATTRCLNMLRLARRRPRPEAHLAELNLPEPTRSGEVSWVEPYPDALLEGLADPAPGPEAQYETREAISLAFITALQLLPPRQRAVQILRDVLGYQAREVAHILDSSEESVTSALKRARATLQLRVPPPGERDEPPATSAAERELVQRFTRAFESSDMAAWSACSPMMCCSTCRRSRSSGRVTSEPSSSWRLCGEGQRDDSSRREQTGSRRLGCTWRSQTPACSSRWACWCSRLRAAGSR
jgi:RNA polymerase sigma-70 factor, ECF subfamily